MGISTNTFLPARTASTTSLCCGRKQGLPNTRAFTKSGRSICASSADMGSSTSLIAGMEAGGGGGGAPALALVQIIRPCNHVNKVIHAAKHQLVMMRKVKSSAEQRFGICLFA